MGTIAQKLEYLNDTRLLLKDNINKINNVLDDNSIFRSYPQELFNGYLDILNNGTDTLWSNLEKVSQTGTEPVLENVETAPIKMVLNGNTSQETTTGKNIFNYTRTTKTITTNGVTSTINDDGSITLDGTATALTWFVLNSAFNWESGDYTMYLTDNEIVGLLLYSDIGVTGAIKQINVPTTITKNIALRIESGTTFNNLTIFPMILKGKYTLENIGDYESYTGGQPSPSPDYPQQVKVVKGENVVSVQGKNLFKEWISASINPNTGEISATPRNLTDKILVKSNTTYTMWREDIGFGMYAIEFDKDDNHLATSVIVSADTTRTFTTNANTSYVRLYQYTPYSPTNKAQLEQNSQATPYVPYSKTDYPINLGDIELCKINTYKDYFHKDSGKWYVHKEINKVVLDGSEGWTFFSVAQGNLFRNITKIINDINDSNYTPYSNYFKGIPFSQKDNRKNNNFYIGSIDYTLDFMDNRFDNVNDFKTWLSTHNVAVYYPLATPTETEITNTTLIEQLEAIYKAKSVKDKTYITQTNDDLPFILDVEAIKEYEVN